MEKSLNSYPLWKRLLFSTAILESRPTKRIVYVAVMAALCMVSNCFFSFSFFDVQFSLTIFVSLLTGAILGPIFGFCASFIGDFVGYVYNNWGYMYMPWAGLSTATFSLLAGICFNVVISDKRWVLYVKMAILAVVSLLVCTVAISSTGFYFYNKAMGFTTAVVEYVSKTFGSGVSYWGYVAYRLIFKGQIINSLVNYALLFASVPLLNSIKPLKLHLR